jgi:ribulose kinase
MSSHKHAIGLDFGSGSGRAVLVDVTGGRRLPPWSIFARTASRPVPSWDS